MIYGRDVALLRLYPILLDVALLRLYPMAYSPLQGSFFHYESDVHSKQTN